VYYTVDVDLGGQKIEVVPDTGSFSLLVTSKNCSECPHQGWNPGKSKTYKSLPRKSAQITFGSGRVWVVGARDTVHVGHSTVLNQRIWEIVDMGEGMREIWSSGAEFDGIMGLGMTSIVPDSRNETTLLTNLGIQKFGMCFGHDEDGVESRIYWGDWPKKLMANAKFISMSVIGKRHWAVPMPKFGVKKVGDDNALTMACSGNQGCAAVVDSGTSVLAVPLDQLAQLYEIIGKIEKDCSNYHMLPELVFYLGGDDEQHKFTLPVRTYVRKVVRRSIDQQKLWDSQLNDYRIETVLVDYVDHCIPMFVESPLGASAAHGPVWILGQPFMRRFQVMYDRSERKMGFTPNDPHTNCPDVSDETNDEKFEFDAMNPGKKNKLYKKEKKAGIDHSKSQGSEDDTIFAACRREDLDESERAECEWEHGRTEEEKGRRKIESRVLKKKTVKGDDALAMVMKKRFSLTDRDYLTEGHL